MRRADRLFQIIQVLRRATRPLTAAAIAEELETSKRTIYRDIVALIGQRVPIRGEAGVGYVLDRGFDLPPLMLTEDEIEAVALGCDWVVANADAHLARAAMDVRAKVSAIVPKRLRALIDDPVVGTPPRDRPDPPQHDIARLREWCRAGRKLRIRYADVNGKTSERAIRPFLVGYVTGVRVVIAYCELRKDFRIFRLDRLREVEFLRERYPESPAVLRRRWRAMSE